MLEHGYSEPTRYREVVLTSLNRGWSAWKNKKSEMTQENLLLTCADSNKKGERAFTHSPFNLDPIEPFLTVGLLPLPTAPGFTPARDCLQ